MKYKSVSSRGLEYRQQKCGHWTVFYRWNQQNRVCIRKAGVIGRWETDGSKASLDSHPLAGEARLLLEQARLAKNDKRIVRHRVYAAAKEQFVREPMPYLKRPSDAMRRFVKQMRGKSLPELEQLLASARMFFWLMNRALRRNPMILTERQVAVALEGLTDALSKMRAFTDYLQETKNGAGSPEEKSEWPHRIAAMNAQIKAATAIVAAEAVFTAARNCETRAIDVTSTASLPQIGESANP